MLEVLIRQHFHDNTCILADSDSKPKLETVAGKVKVKSVPSSVTAFVVDCLNKRSCLISLSDYCLKLLLLSGTY